MTRSFWHLLHVDPGFEPAGVLTFEIMTASRIYSVSETRVLRRELLERMEALPGVERAGTSSYLPLTNPVARGGVIIGYLASERNWPDEPVGKQTVWVGPGYFSALGIPLLAGRTFEPADNEQENEVAVVSTSLAERLFPGEDPLGKRMSQLRAPNWQTVVGVVGDVSLLTLEGEEYAETPEMHYLPWHMVGGALLRTMRFVVRAAVPPLSLVDEVREVVRSIDPTLAIAHVQAMEEVVADARAQMAFTMVLLAIASVVALLLGSIGIYGVLAYVVGRRTNEIGVRMALGARASEVSRMLLRQGAAVVLVGLAVGLAGAFALTRLMSAILFNVSPTDPATYTVVVSFLLAVALVATYLPARKAASIDPVEALRAD